MNISDCEREPIHTPEAIQPHGALMVLKISRGFHVSRLSANAAVFFSVSVDNILGQLFATLIDETERDSVISTLRTLDGPDFSPRLSLNILFHVADWQRRLTCTLHRQNDLILVDIEACEDHCVTPTHQAYGEAHRITAHLRRSAGLSDLCNRACQVVRELTGFDRVLLYVFDADWNGQVIAETKRDGIAAYLDLHFPASDIPRQARELYTRNSFRFIPHVDYEPVTILRHISDANEPLLDLTMSQLRSVSPTHRIYMRNMSATASMSISLHRDAELWGLISCTHENGPLYLSQRVRSACDFVGELVSSLLATNQRDQNKDEEIRYKTVQAQLLQFMTQQEDFVQGLLSYQPNVLDVCGADGAAIFLNDELWLAGKTPDREEVLDLIRWLRERDAQDLLATDSLPALYPASEAYKNSACGVLATSLSSARTSYILWFRPEVVQTLKWGGNPQTGDAGEKSALHPRNSFELWKEIVHNKSVAWREVECNSARQFSRAILDIVMQNFEKMARLNTELERSNVELDSFAFAASHDLKEPLRGIHNYTALVVRELGDAHLIGESRMRLDTVLKLTQRMEDLINSLLHYSHVGRTDLAMRAVNMDSILMQTRELVLNRLQDHNITLSVEAKLPAVYGDTVLLSEVITNLVTNAIKYNDKSAPEVHVGVQSRTAVGDVVFYVRDNGIGIPEKNFGTIFKIFRRLHGRDKFGGGTGTGLTIAKRIIERHGGKMWLTSFVGEGTTFFFNLREAAAE